MKRVLMCLTILSCCGGDAPDDLSKDAVTNIPPGTATGSVYAGDYAIELVTIDCSGDCLIYGDGVCDISDIFKANMEVEQANGSMQSTTNNAQIQVSRLKGAINEDGSFDIGGLATEGGGQIVITARATGEITGTKISGLVRGYGAGSVENDGISCSATYELSGEKK